MMADIAAVWFCLPETKNATLEDMDRVFTSRTGESDKQLLAECRSTVGLGENLEFAAVDEARKMSIGGEKDAAARVEAV